MSEQPKYAEVLLFQKVGPEKDTLTYSLPQTGEYKTGMIVEVPLRNRPVKGVIYRIHNNKPEYKTREINKIVENAPHLENWQMTLLDWMADYYFCPKFKVLRLFVPVSIVRKKRGLKESAPDVSDDPFTLKFRHKLSADQQKTLKQYRETQKKVSLLHGITGSGKTEIYLHVVEDALKLNKQVLILIPEISLSPQMQKRFEDHFHEQTRVIHSRLTLKQKEEAWQSIARGHTKIVIGSRSSLFAPFKNLGCIMIDEEHDHSYKQDQAPRYHTVTVAREMANLLDIKILMGSATPSIESYHAAKTGVFEHLHLSERPQKGISLPSTRIVDLRKEILKKNFSIFATELQDLLTARLKENEQSILFLNRRGAASAVICRVCGFVYNCGKCDIPMTYHKKFSVEGNTFNAERLICHHCGLIDKVPLSCPVCQSPYIKYIGLGTQRVEEELKKMYPLAKIIRADRDTTQQRDSFKNIFETFKNGKADILVGTQMIAIGLHLPKVNLVGIVLADMGLTLPDFRSGEQTFQLITQVAGRAGRETAGEAVIQTYLPNHYAIKAAARHDYIGFFEQVIKIRKELNQPPFSNLVKITIKDQNGKKCLQKTEKIADMLESQISKTAAKTDSPPKIAVNSYPALIPRLNGVYRWHILLTGKNPSKILKQLSPTDLRDLIIDVDPASTL